MSCKGVGIVLWGSDGRGRGHLGHGALASLGPRMVGFWAVVLALNGCGGRGTLQAGKDGAAPDGQSQPGGSGGVAGGPGADAESDAGVVTGGATGGVGTGGTSIGGQGGATGLGGKAGSGGAGGLGGVMVTGGTATGGATGLGGKAGSGGATGLGGERGSGGAGGLGGIMASGGIASGGAAGTTTSQVCREGETRCVATVYLEICRANAWVTLDACGEHQECTSSNGAPQCACIPDPDCTVESASCAGSSTLVTCLRDARSCLFKSTSVCNERSCVDLAGSASCCAKTCTVGSLGCATNAQIGMCALAADGCSAYTVTETCGDGLVCGEHAVPECFDSRWADWPMPNGVADVSAGAPNPASLTDNGDGTVTDNVTNLMWQQGQVSKGVSWSDAFTYCSSLALAGHRDWRVPSIIELMSIVDHSLRSKVNGKYQPTIDLVYFPGTAGDPYWSSNPTIKSGYAYAVEYAAGMLDALRKETVAHVRCVRR
jgi:hypothetical protein